MKCEKDKGTGEVAVEMVPFMETAASQLISNDTDKQAVKREPLVFNFCAKTFNKTTLPK